MSKRSLIIAIILCLNIAIGSATADPNLVGWWKFDQVTSGSTPDSSGNGYNGTVSGATLTEDGQDGSALNFSGTGNYVTIPSGTFSTINKEITICCWSYGADTLPVTNHFFYGANSSSQRVLNAHVPWSSGAIIFDAGHTGTGDATNTNYDRISKNAESASQYKGEWNHWAFTKNTTSGEMKVYLNGVLWNSAAGKTKPMTGITQFKIGNKLDGSMPYQGTIDDFKIFNRELSENEIKTMLGVQVTCEPSAYDLNGDCDVNFADVEELAKIWLLGDQTVAAAEPDNSHLQVFYKFNEQSGRTAYDSSGKGRDGVVEANEASVVWIAGPAGNCMNMDGTFGIKIPASVFGTVSDAMTITVDVNSPQTIVTRVDFSAGTGDEILWDNVSWQNEDLNSVTQWAHYAFVKDAGSSIMRIYRNGLIAAQNADANDLVDGANAGESYIGASASGGDFFSGTIDNFCVYDYALTQAEIVYLAKGSQGQVEQPMKPFICPIDPYEDGAINYIDFSLLAEKWMQKQQ